MKLIPNSLLEKKDLYQTLSKKADNILEWFKLLNDDDDDDDDLKY